MKKHDHQENSISKAAGTIGRAATGTIHRFRDLVHQTHARSGLPERSPGSAPGFDFTDVLNAPPLDEHQRAKVTCIDYCSDRVETRELSSHEISNLDQYHRPDWCKVRWINVDGIKDLHTIYKIADHYKLHSLAVEDLLYAPHRPKIELYGPEHGVGEQSRTFILARMIQLDRERHITVQQISLFMGKHTVLTFLQTRSDVWQPIKDRINREGSRLRSMEADFLVYALLDAVIDHGFPVLETYSDRLEEMESRVFDAQDESMIRDVHALKHELLLLRRHFWPMRELIQQLQHLPEGVFQPMTKTYLGDVYDHSVQVLEMIESYREMSMGLIETYMSVINNRMNAVMKVLTIIASIFIPITFITGMYGMNFEDMPGLKNPYAFWIFCVVSFLIVSGMLIWFRKQRWI